MGRAPRISRDAYPLCRVAPRGGFRSVPTSELASKTPLAA